MHNTKKKNVLHIFLKLFGVSCHIYPINFSLINFSVTQTFLKTTRLAISAFQLEVHFFRTAVSQKTKKKLITFYFSKKRAIEKIMELRTVANFFQ